MAQAITKVSDVPDGYTLITGSYEVEQVLDHIGANREGVGLFVKTKDGDYVSVLAFSGCVPYLHKRVEELLDD